MEECLQTHFMDDLAILQSQFAQFSVHLEWFASSNPNAITPHTGQGIDVGLNEETQPPSDDEDECDASVEE